MSTELPAPPRERLWERLRTRIMSGNIRHTARDIPPRISGGMDRAGASLAELLEGLGALAWELDPGSEQITYVSGAAERLLGYPRERWLTEPGFLFELLVREEDREELRSGGTDGAGHPLVWQLRDREGGLHWMRTLLEEVGGAAPRVRGLMVDVTAERTASDQLANEVRRVALASTVGALLNEAGSLDALLQRSAESIVETLEGAAVGIWTVDESGVTLVLRASAGADPGPDGDLRRVPVGEPGIGRIAEERAPYLTNDVAADPVGEDRDWVREQGVVAFAGYPLLLQDRVLGVLTLFSRTELAAESLDSLGVVAERLALVIDQKQSHERLREREAQLAAAQRIAGLGSWEWEVGGNAVSWSDELYRMFGLEPQSEPCTFESYLARVHPGDRERVGAILERAVREGGGFDFEQRIVRPRGEVRTLHSRGHAIAGKNGETVRLVGTSQDVTGQRDAAARELELLHEQALRRVAEQAEKRSRLLAEVSRNLASSLDFEVTLRNLAFTVVPDVADWCTIDVVGEDGRTHRVVTAHPDPEKQRLAEELGRRYPAGEDAGHGVPHVLRTGKPELVPRIPHELLESVAVDEEHLRMIEELDLRSYMVVPLIARGRTLGAITMICAESGGEYDTTDLAFGEELANRAALALDNARLYRDAERARAHTARILSSISDAFFSLDREWRFAYINDQAEQVLSRSRDELLGRVIWDEFPAALGTLVQEKYEQAVAENRTIQFEEYYPQLHAWYEVRAYPSPDGLSIYFHDITQKRAAQDEAREREAQFRFLADTIPQQVWITRPDGYHEYYNQRWYDYTGTTEEEAKGTGWARLLHPDDHERAQKRWRRSLETGEPYSIEYRFRRASDGQYRWFLGQALPQRGANGEIVRWFGTLTDIQDQKEQEGERDRLIAELELERARLQQIFQEAPAFIATLRGSDHVFESANPPYLQLIGHRDVIGKPVAEALPEVVGQGFVQLLDHVLATGEAFLGRETRIMLQREPGGESEERILDFVYQPMIDVEGTPAGIFVHGVDVTDQVRAREQVEGKAAELLRITRALELSNRELDQFAYVASHDLKAPLRGIANLSQWLEEDFGGEISAEAREHLELLRGRVHRMEGLIDGILQYSRAGRMRELPESVDVGELIDEVVDLLAPPEEAQIRVGEMPALQAERLPLQQVFMNLIGNALKYSGPVPRVEISVRDAGDFHEFVVADEGPGIAPEFHDRIFGIFQTLEARDRVEGTGIGLSLVRKVVDSRRGRVWVESGVGAGAAFHFLWPKHQQAES
jgi:PAS domain S-box-containing protein